MRPIIDEYGETLVAVVIVIMIILTAYFVLPLIADFLPSFLDSIIGVA